MPCNRHKRADATAARARFVSRDGDHATLLAVFRMYQQVTFPSPTPECMQIVSSGGPCTEAG